MRLRLNIGSHHAKSSVPERQRKRKEAVQPICLSAGDWEKRDVKQPREGPEEEEEEDLRQGTKKERRHIPEVLEMDDFKCVLDSLQTMHMAESECYLNAISKLLGYMIVIFSAVVKLPQIYIILKNNSIEGLSPVSFELETVGFTVALSYIMTKNLPFSAYGELVFLLIQALGLNVLIYSYMPSLGPITFLKGTLYALIAPTLLAGNLDPISFEILYASSHVIFVGARLPQIFENFKAKSTGQLSLLTNLMNTAGCIVRTFTTIQEKGPISMVMGSVFGIITNGIIVLQIIIYSRDDKKKKDEKED